GVVAVPVPPDLVEDTLQHILGLVASHEAAQVAEDHGAEGGVALLDRPLLAGGESGPQVGAGALLHSSSFLCLACRRAGGVRGGGSGQGPPIASRCSAMARPSRRAAAPHPVKGRPGSCTWALPNRSGSEVSKPTNAIGSGRSVTSSHWFWRAAWFSGS